MHEGRVAEHGTVRVGTYANIEVGVDLENAMESLIATSVGMCTYFFPFRNRSPI